MNLIQKNAPHIRNVDTNRTMMIDMILTLVILSGMAYLFYGFRSILVCLVGIAMGLLCDVICTLIRGRMPNFRDYSSVITGLIVALLMPATIEYHIVAVAVLFATVIVKHPFGGTGENLFNPAAAGFAFVAICFPTKIFSYPIPFSIIHVTEPFTGKMLQNPAYTLKLGGVPSVDATDMILGNFAGPMGATNILVIVACLIFLFCRNTIRWQLPVSFIATVAVIAAIFPRADLLPIQSVAYELMSGSLLFGAVFVLTDPVTSPKRDSSMVIYGILSGGVAMLFRYFGTFEESMMFTVLFMNAFVPIIDKYNEKIHSRLRRVRIESEKTKKA